MRLRIGFTGKKGLILATVNIALVFAFIASIAASRSIRDALRSQQAAVAWAGQSEERFAQISAFLPRGAVFDENSIRSFRETVDRALVDASIEADQGRSLYTDAWSAVSETYVVGDRGSANAQVYGVGGDFFLFHPLHLRDGSYFSQSDLMKDRVILDEELAWRLFGSVYLEGLSVRINNRPYFIAGVISRESDKASSIAYTGGAGMFMSYEALDELTGGSAEIICYEIVLPDPISGFAVKTFSDRFPVRSAAIMENSARYTFESIFRILSTFGVRSMRADGIVYPYWENAARYTEDWLALLLVLSFVSFAFPAICTVVWFIKAIRRLIWGGKHSLRRVIEQREERKAEEYKNTIVGAGFHARPK